MNSAASNPPQRKRNSCSICKLSYVLLWLLTCSGPALAAPNAGKAPSANDIKITNRDNGRIEEFRIAGRIYMIKVNPQNGTPYYLIDSNGDGDMDTRKTEVDEHLMIPSWTLLRWK